MTNFWTTLSASNSDRSRQGGRNGPGATRPMADIRGGGGRGVAGLYNSTTGNGNNDPYGVSGGAAGRAQVQMDRTAPTQFTVNMPGSTPAAAPRQTGSRTRGPSSFSAAAAASTASSFLPGMTAADTRRERETAAVGQSLGAAASAQRSMPAPTATPARAMAGDVRQIHRGPMAGYAPGMDLGMTVPSEMQGTQLPTAASEAAMRGFQTAAEGGETFAPASAMEFGARANVGSGVFPRPDIQQWIDANRNAPKSKIDGKNIVDRYLEKHGQVSFAPAAGGAEAAPSIGFAEASGMQTQDLGLTPTAIDGFQLPENAFSRPANPAAYGFSGNSARRDDQALAENSLTRGGSAPVQPPEEAFTTGFTSDWINRNMTAPNYSGAFQTRGN